MESNINYNTTEIRYSHGRLLGQKRQISDKEAKSPAVTSPTLAEVKAKMASGQKLTNEETQVLLDNIKKTEAEYNIKRLRQIENAAKYPRTGYRPLDNKVKGGFERAIDKMHQLGETKAELAERSAKMAEKFAKLLEFCKKYGKSIKA